MTFDRNKVWKDDVTLWSDSLKKYPMSFRIQNNLATAYVQSGETHLAEKAFLQSIKLNPGKAEAKINLAILYLNQGRLEEALRVIKDIDLKELRGPFVFFNLGVIYAKQGDLTKAIDFYQPRKTQTTPMRTSTWVWSI